MFDNLTLMRKEHDNLRIPYDYYNAKINRMNEENLPYFNNDRFQRNLDKQKQAKENYKE